MRRRRFVVIGAGEVGFHLARLLSQEGHNVVVIERTPERCAKVEEELDVALVPGDGAHLPVLRQAEVGRADLVLAVSSSDEANLVASLLSKRMGAARSLVRVRIAEEVTAYHREYEEAFAVDLLLSTQLLTTLRILDFIRGHNTVAVEYLAGGKVQLRKFHLDEVSPLARMPLRDIDLPRGALVVGYQRATETVIPSGDSRALPGDDALILALTEVMPKVERLVSGEMETPGPVVIAGGGETGFTVARALESWGVEVKILEVNRQRAQELAALFPRYQILHGDATDLAFLRAERIGHAKTFVALTGQDERNLLASLLAQELGISQAIALVERTETSRLWKRLGGFQIVSPRGLASERIRDYIKRDFNPTIVSLQEGALILERRLSGTCPAAGKSLAELGAPPGLIVGAVVRGEKVFVPHGKDRLEEGDSVILFCSEEALGAVHRLFPTPGKETLQDREEGMEAGS